MPADIVIYAIVAAGLVVWLRSILGTRHGEERQRPTLFDAPQTKTESDATDAPAHAMAAAQTEAESVNAIEDFLKKQDHQISDTARANLETIVKKDSRFAIEEFMRNAGDAFAIVLEAFAQGDRETLRQLLADPVYNAFNQAIEDREQRGERVETQVHAIHQVTLQDAQLDKNMAYLVLQIRAFETSLVKDQNDAIIAGDPDAQTQICDVWVFGRNLKSPDPTWFVYETRDDEPEDHKTPVPDVSNADIQK